MSHARMTDSLEVWSENEETAAWSLVALRLPAAITELSPEGSRRENRGAGVNEPDVTHTIRMGPEANETSGDGFPLVCTGRRLRNGANGDEYVVKAARWRANPPPGTLIVTAAGGVKAATQG